MWAAPGGNRVRVTVIDGPVGVNGAESQGRGGGARNRVAHFWIREIKSGRKRCVEAGELTANS